MFSSPARLLTILACVLYAAIRLWGLADACLWFDEIFSVHAAEHTWATILPFVAVDLIHPPLFYFLLKMWIGIGGDGVFWLRLFPAIVSILVLVPFLLLCRELKMGEWTRVLALVLLAVNGSMVKYAQEVRMYSPLVFLSITSLWLFARYFNRGKSFVPLVIVNILLVYTHYFGWLMVLSQVVAIIIFQRIKLRRIALMTVIVAASFLPWAVAVLRAAAGGSEVSQNIDWIRRPGFREIRVFLIDLVEPFYQQASTSQPTSLLVVAGPIFLLTLVAGVIFLIQWKLRDAEERNRGLWLAVFVAVPITVAFAGSWLLPYAFWGTRHLIIIFVPAALLMANAFTTISPKWLRILLVTLLVGYKSFGFIRYAAEPFEMPQWCGFDRLANEIKFEGGTAVYAFEDLAAYHLWYTGRKDEVPIKISKIADAQDMTEDKAFFLPRGFDAVGSVGSRKINEDQFWIIYRS